MRRRLLETHKNKIIEIVYSDISVSLTYNGGSRIPASGGDYSPEVTWSQSATYPDGSVIQITSYDSISFTGSGITPDSNGTIHIPSTESETVTNLGSITVTITANGKTGSSTFTLMQAAYENNSNLEMDVILWNKETRDRYYVSKDDFNINDYSPDIYKPVGIVVIPGGHERYGDKNTIGVMSLMNASTSSPDIGANETLYFGCYAEEGGESPVCDMPLLIPYNVKDNVIYDEMVGAMFEDLMSVGPYFPSDEYDGFANTLDDITYYKVDNVEKGVPSPYLSSGGASSVYIDEYDPKPDFRSCFAEFDGEGICYNDLELLNQLGYKEWLSYGELDSNYNGLYLPGIMACWRHSIDGTSESQWHLPTPGEFGYILSRAKAINNTLEALASYYDLNELTDYIKINVNNTYLTCITYFNHFNESDGSTRNYCIGIKNGNYAPIGHDERAYVRPLMKLTDINGYGNIGQHLGYPYGNSRCGVFRCYTSVYNVNWPQTEDPISFEVYGVLVAGKDNLTVLKTGVHLCTIENCLLQKFGDEASETGIYNYSTYNENVEPGWYVLEYVKFLNGVTNGQGIDRTSNLTTGTYNVGDVLSSEKNWEGNMSICYNYKNFDSMFDVSSVDFVIIGRNEALYAFRVGYWNYNTAIYLYDGAEELDSFDTQVLPNEDYDPTDNNVLYVREYMGTPRDSVSSGRVSNTATIGESGNIYNNFSVCNLRIYHDQNNIQLGIFRAHEGDQVRLSLYGRCEGYNEVLLETWDLVAGSEGGNIYKRIGQYDRTFTYEDFGCTIYDYGSIKLRATITIYAQNMSYSSGLVHWGAFIAENVYK